MIAVNNITMRFGGRVLFDEVSFLISPNDKIGLTGRNGAGKSTLLKVLKGIHKPDEGDISMPKETTIGYLPQDIKVDTDKTVLDETMTAFERIVTLEKELEDYHRQMAERTDFESESYMQLINDFNEKQHQYQLLGGYDIEQNVERVLKGLGFEQSDFQRPVSELSGGWKMRIELAKLLLQRPSLILLDEPTNHLDIESITWLEGFLKDYEGAIMLVSHDKTFLDNITNRTIEITLGRVEDYKANYSKYLELREERRETLEAAKKNQERKIAQMERNIDRFRAKANKASFAQSLIKQLDKMDRIEIEAEDTSAIAINFPECRHSGKMVVKGGDIRKSFGDKNVIRGLDFEIGRGERVAFVGKNGMGKTTLSRIIVGELDHEGKLTLGHNVMMGYFAQHQAADMANKNTVLEAMEKAATAQTSSEVRSILGAFLFSGDDVYKKVQVLSGGERARLAMAKLLLQPHNFLVLDEPTNHLDMVAKDVLKQALKNFKGTLVVVSHDRDFLQGLTDKVFEFKKDGIQEHLGDIDHFLYRKKMDSFRHLEMEKEAAEQQAAKTNSDSDNKKRFERKKQLEKDIRKLKNQVSKQEKTIDKLDKQIAEMEAKLKDPETFQKLSGDQEFFNEYNALKQQQEDATQAWDSAVEELGKLEEEAEAI